MIKNTCGPLAEMSLPSNKTLNVKYRDIQSGSATVSQNYINQNSFTQHTTEIKATTQYTTTEVNLLLIFKTVSYRTLVH